MRKLVLSGIAVALFAVVAIPYTKWNHKQNLARNHANIKLSALAGPGGVKSLKAKTAIGSVLGDAAMADVASDLSTEREIFKGLVYETDRMDIMALEDLMQKLRDFPPALLDGLFVEELRDIGSANPQARAQLVFAANRLQADELLPFWEDLALRTTPRSEDESEALGQAELNLDAKVIHGEMAMAIRNLGLIAYRDPAARAILERIILDPTPQSHPTFVREAAFSALRESDGRAVLRLLPKLPSRDPLRTALRSHIADR